MRCWKLRTAAKATGHDFWQQLEALRDGVQVEDDRSLDLERLKMRKNEAFKHLRSTQAKHKERRRGFLDVLVEHMEQKMGIDKNTAQKQMQQAERRLSLIHI